MPETNGPISRSDIDDHRVFSDDEISQMEDEKQYHGTDPIVRARLGLPSRDTKRIAR